MSRLFLDPSYSWLAAKQLGADQDAMEALFQPIRNAIPSSLEPEECARPGWDDGAGAGTEVSGSSTTLGPGLMASTFLAIYANNEQENLTDADKKVIRKNRRRHQSQRAIRELTSDSRSRAACAMSSLTWRVPRHWRR
jgi:hypothetical protein